MGDYYVGQEFVGVYPPEAADWCNENQCGIDVVRTDDGERVWRIVETPDEVTYAPPDTAPSREELAEAAAELGDMMAELHEGMQTCMDALAEIGDMVAEMRA